MKLYDAPRTPNPRRVRIFLHEKGISVPAEHLDLADGDHRAAQYRRLNPYGLVPTLVLDSGEAISESIAICRYFEALHPEPALFGAGALDIARVEMWNRRMEFHLYQPVAHAFRHLHPGMKDFEVPQVAEWGEANKPRVLATLRLLDGELAGREFIAGDRFTVADITALVAIDFLKPARIAVPEELGHLARWYAAVSARPSAAA
ncbi:MAG TPA: glutathione S-transferase [Xanthobacteraceae bacterium]|nr:glutathione S-transferase [Xanthobacteraceae bacterium]